jgi:drug/metabolite transporter (DMT)-like permease
VWRCIFEKLNLILKTNLIGILFASLWASASVATKFGVLSTEPLVLANIRFFIAGSLLLGAAYSLKPDATYRLPRGDEWKQLATFGFFNTTVYLGLYVFAMKYSAAGIGSLSTSASPLMMVILSAFWLKRKPSRLELAGLILGMAGIAIATFPLLKANHTTALGGVLLLVSMLAVSWASVYYATVKWELPNVLINGWQVTIGGILLVPVTLLFSDLDATVWGARLWGSIVWLSLMVSVVGLMCWFYLLKIDTVRASLWLFLCPLFGFFYAWLLMDEPITYFTWLGTGMVVSGLYLAQKQKLKI